MKHKQKVKIARRLRTKKDIQEHAPIFNTESWEKRKKATRQRVLKKQSK